MLYNTVRKLNYSSTRSRLLDWVFEDDSQDDGPRRALADWQAFSTLYWPKLRDRCKAEYAARHPPMVHLHEIAFRRAWLIQELDNSSQEIKDEVQDLLDQAKAAKESQESPAAAEGADVSSSPAELLAMQKFVPNYSHL